MWVQLNDQIVPESQAVVSVFDRGFLYGDGVFETMRAYQGLVFRLDDHLMRLAASAAALRLRVPRTASQVRDDIQRVLDRNRLTDAIVRVTVSRGRGKRGPGVAGADSPTYVISTEVLPDALSGKQARGQRLTLSSIRKISPDALPASAKHTNYLNAILAFDDATPAGADEVVMLDANLRVTECATANIFFVRKSCVHTPPASVGILNGVTRGLVIDLARGAGLETDESLFGMDALLSAEEVFVTNSVVGPCPVRAVDARTYAVPAPVTRQLVRLYCARVHEDTGGTH